MFGRIIIISAEPMYSRSQVKEILKTFANIRYHTQNIGDWIDEKHVFDINSSLNYLTTNVENDIKKYSLQDFCGTSLKESLGVILQMYRKHRDKVENPQIKNTSLDKKLG